jgi:DNA-binding NarL/FixJ family response regulator
VTRREGPKVLHMEALVPAEDPAFRRVVLVVEDDDLLRVLMLGALSERGFEAVGAGSAVEATRMFRDVDPDGIVMDIDLGPGPNGFDLAETFLGDQTGVAIVFLTNLPDPRFAGRSPKDLPPGIAYLRKGALRGAEALVQAVDRAIRGVVDNDMRHDRDPSRPLASLTRAQVDILRLVALGNTNQQIADTRGTTVQAVERTVTRTLAALGVEKGLVANRRVEAARLFFDLAGRPLPAADQEAR